MPTQKQFIPHTQYTEYPVKQMKERAHSFYEDLKRRRTVRDFSNKEVPREVIEDCLMAPVQHPMVLICSRGTLWLYRMKE